MFFEALLMVLKQFKTLVIFLIFTGSGNPLCQLYDMRTDKNIHNENLRLIIRQFSFHNSLYTFKNDVNLFVLPVSFYRK
jgi:hypothetical protein